MTETLRLTFLIHSVNKRRVGLSKVYKEVVFLSSNRLTCYVGRILKDAAWVTFGFQWVTNWPTNVTKRRLQTSWQPG